MKSRQLSKIAKILFLFIILGLALLLSNQPVQSAPSITVTNTNDSGAGSLRAAIEAANLSSGPQIIEFNIPGCSATCVIQPDSSLPALTSGDTTIDGYSQTGAAPATASSNAIIKIELDGRYIVAWNGLDISSSNNVIRGLSIHRFQGNGIWINGSSATGNVIEGNYIGFNPDLSSILGNGLDGVLINLGAQNNTIGGIGPATRNVIAANGLSGLEIHGALTTSNIVTGNYIGSHPDGAGGLGNAQHGARIYGGAHDNTIGGDTAGERNLLSGNTMDGVRIEGSGSDNNLIKGNYIGVDVSGISTVENGENGVHIMNGAKNNTIGGATSAEGNVISGNMISGVRINGAGTQGNVISKNFIGLGADGLYDLGNAGIGIYLYGASADTVIGPGNVISGNQLNGIWIDGVDNTQLSGNYIGTNASGDAARKNDSYGIMVSSGAANTQIGGDTPGARNIISGNDGYGIFLAGDDTHNITIEGNFIGLGVNGKTGLSNDGGGIRIENGVQDVTIGGDTPAERNLISGNLDYGIAILGEDTQNIIITGNYIGTDVGGLLDRGNKYSGIHIYNGPHNVFIGGIQLNKRNVISGNDESGIDLWGGSYPVTDITIIGNFIGLGADGATSLGNLEQGIILGEDVSQVMIGGDSPGDRNIISGNGNNGIYLQGSDVTQNTIIGNYIGTDSSGLIPVGNTHDGVLISFYAHDNTIGPDNLIANNREGVRLDTPLAIGNKITRNTIFNNNLEGIHLTNGANNAIQPPVIDTTTHDPYLVSGTACPGCLVEIFQNIDDDGEGRLFLGDTAAHIVSGDFSLALPFVFPYLTATATDSSDDTSEFSAVFEVTFKTILIPLAYR
ncbi:MAG: beta strand repeat-containing protein [Anaerolineales bacterium]